MSARLCGVLSSVVAASLAGAAPAPSDSPLVAQLERMAAGTAIPGLQVSFAPAATGCPELSIVGAAAGPVLRCRPETKGAAASLCGAAAAGELTRVVSTVAGQGVFSRAFPEEQPREAPSLRFRLANLRGGEAVEKTFYGTPPALGPLVERLKALGTACATEAAAIQPPRSIGVATMKPDGTIVLDLVASGPGTHGDARLVYPPGHAQYQSVLAHLGGLRPGETKPVPPWPEPR